MASWGETFKVHLTAGERGWLLWRGRGEGHGSKVLQEVPGGISGSASTAQAQWQRTPGVVSWTG